MIDIIVCLQNIDVHDTERAVVIPPIQPEQDLVDLIQYINYIMYSYPIIKGQTFDIRDLNVVLDF